MLENISPHVWTFLSAELILVLVRSADIKILFKKRSQQSTPERKQVDQGLFRSVLLEVFIFVPVSAWLALLVVQPLFSIERLGLNISEQSYCALLGVASYGFPFATIRRVVQRIALNTLKEFGTLGQPEEAENEDQSVEAVNEDQPVEAENENQPVEARHEE